MEFWIEQNILSLMVRILLTAFLLAYFGHVIQGQMSVDDLCHWNYTIQNKRGADLYKVTGAADKNKCPYQRNIPAGNFNITVLGDESDMKRKLNIEWETSQTSVRVMVSFADVTVSRTAVPIYGCFVFHTKQVSRRPLRLKHLHFDCLEIDRGVNGTFHICELGTRTVCKAIDIDTTKCSCAQTFLNATIGPHQENGFTKHFIDIHYKEASPNMSVYFTVLENGGMFYNAKENYNLSSSGLVRIPRPLERDGNYRVQVSLYCLDFSKQRANKKCQSRVFGFNVTSPVTKTVTPKPPGPPVNILYVVDGCLGILTVCLLPCLIYKLCKRRRGAQNSALNNEDVSSAILSPHHNPNVEMDKPN